MAVTNIYVNNGNVGAKDGTTEAKGWPTLGEAEDDITTNTRTDVHVWVKNTGVAYDEAHATVGGVAVLGILFGAGTATAPIVWESYTITIGDTGYDPDSRVVIDASGGGDIVTGIACLAVYNNFIGFDITSSLAIGVSIADNVTFVNCRFQNNGGDGLSQEYGADFVICINCEFDNNSGKGADVGTGTFVNCSAYNNTSYGCNCVFGGIFINCLGFGNEEFGSGVTPFVANVKPFIVYGCTCDGNNQGNGTWLVGESGVAAQCLAVNNIFYNCLYGLVGKVGEDPSYNFPNLNNLYYDNATDTNITGGVDADHGDVLADPLFVDVGSDDYQLRPGSPAINAGLGTNIDIGYSQANRNQIPRGRRHNV